MADKAISYTTRFYVKSPGGPYDPAPLHEFDLEEQVSPPSFAAGDIVFAWSRIGNEAQGSYRYYKVVERAFRFDQDEIFVFVLVEEVGEQWPGQFG